MAADARIFSLTVLLLAALSGCVAHDAEDRKTWTNRDKILHVMGKPLTEMKHIDGSTTLVYAFSQDGNPEPCMTAFEFDRDGKYISHKKSGCLPAKKKD